jgi:hypothetical protein
MGSWNPISFAFLIINAFFCASAACLLIHLGSPLVGRSTSFMAALLYLLNFNIPNAHLSGSIDSGEAFFFIVLISSLLSNRWRTLPLLSAAGVLAKQTYLPFSVLFSAVWLAALAKKDRNFSKLGWVFAMAFSGLVSYLILQSLVLERIIWPGSLDFPLRPLNGFFSRLFQCVANRGFSYVFLWLLPLGAFRLRHFPKPWVSASLAAALLVFILSAYVGEGPNTARPLFNIIGALLSLSAADFLVRSILKTHE